MRLRSRYDREILEVPALGSLAAEPLYILVDTAIVGWRPLRRCGAGTDRIAGRGSAAHPWRRSCP